MQTININGKEFQVTHRFTEEEKLKLYPKIIGLDLITKNIHGKIRTIYYSDPTHEDDSAYTELPADGLMLYFKECGTISDAYIFNKRIAKAIIEREGGYIWCGERVSRWLYDTLERYDNRINLGIKN